MVDEVNKDDVVVDDTTTENEDTPPEPNIFDAVSDAIDEQTVGLDTSADDAPPGDNDDGTPTDKTPDDKEKDAENEGGDGEPKADEPVDGEGDDEPKDGDKEDLPGADGSGDKVEPTAEKPDGEVKELDHVNDPIPKELAEKTQERIRSLADRVKVAEAGVTERSSDLDEMISMVQETGTSGEQYGQVLGFMKLFNSDKVEDQRAAFTVMQQELATMAAKLGEPIVGVDPLEGHPDLQAEIEAGTLTGDRAIEIAAIRGREQADVVRTTTDNANATADATLDQAIVTAKVDLAAFEKSKMSDPQWAQKKAILVPALRATMRVLHPSQWRATFEDSYNKLVLANVPAPTIPKPKTPTPLRPKTPAGEGSKQPSTMAEAIELSLGGSIDD